jgi:hypothetical protein
VALVTLSRQRLLQRILLPTPEVAMRKLLFLTWAAGLLLGGTAFAQETPRAILERAIKAHGGQERLAKIRADQVKLRGVLFLDKKEVAFTAETWVQLPAQFKNVIKFTTDREHVLVQILNGDQAYVTIDGQPEPVAEPALNEMRDTLLLDRAVRLVPLLTDGLFNLAVLEETKVHDRPAAGVKVQVKGRKEMRLYFDKETGLLAKTEHLIDEKGKEVRQEEYYSDFKELGGFRRPTKVLALRNGIKIMEAQLIDVKYLDKIDEAEFAKP